MSDLRGRIPSLDGLRAISISLVVFGHVCGTGNFFPEWVGEYFALGELGVRVFFVISGYLITTLLLTELAKSDTINLGKFYFRRTLRIFPPYYAFLVALVAMNVLGWITLNRGDILHGVTYTSNYHPTRSWNIGHTWSLGVEEQFYLLWPAVLLLAGRRRGLWAAAVLFLASPFVRLALWYSGHSLGDIGHTFETVADALAIGCVLAGTRAWLERQPRYAQFLASKLFLLAPALVLAGALLSQRPRLLFLLGFTMMNLGIAACIHWCLIHHKGRVGRLLNAAPLVYVGVLSYSIYLWQQIFLNRASDSVVNQFPLNLAGVVVASLASYYVIERPSLALRQRLERRWFAPARPASRPVVATPVPAPTPVQAPTLAAE